MDIVKAIINEINNFLKEEFIDDKLYGYHVTSRKNLESIQKNGLKIGPREMEGRGVYGFYDINRALGYGSKDISDDRIIIKFYVNNYDNIFITAPRIAKKIWGDKYTLIDQIERIYKNDGGLKGFYNEVKKANSYMDFDKMIEEINKSFEDYESSEQNIFVFYLVPASLDALKDGYIKDGAYGLQFLIRNPSIITPVSYYEIIWGDNGAELSEEIPINVPIDSELANNPHVNLKNKKKITREELISLINKIDKKIYNARSNSEYDKLVNIKEKLKQLLNGKS